MRSSEKRIEAAVRRCLIVGITGWVVGAGYGLFIPSLARAQRILEIEPISTTGHILAPHLGDWELTGAVTVMTPGEFVRAQPERALLIREYGLRDVATAGYRRSDGSRANVELFRMINYVAAYGAYTIERSVHGERVDVGTEGTAEESRLEFFKGDYYARVSSLEGDDDEALMGLGRRLDEKLGEPHSEIPVLVRQLPVTGLVPGTERFIAGPRGLARVRPPGDQEDVFLLTSLGVEAVTAQYRYDNATSRLMIVEYHTPQLAARGYRRVHAYFLALPEDERAHRILKRVGNYIIEVTNVHDLDTMEQVVDQIRYAPAIRWLGKDPFDYLRKLRAIPRFSSVDWLLTTFGFIGITLVTLFAGGVLLGTVAFLWRRRRLRYLNTFTDAGGMLRLNLNRHVLPVGEPEVRRRLPGA